jgi:hypothetical protein
VRSRGTLQIHSTIVQWFGPPMARTIHHRWAGEIPGEQTSVYRCRSQPLRPSLFYIWAVSGLRRFSLRCVFDWRRTVPHR